MVVGCWYKEFELLVKVYEKVVVNMFKRFLFCKKFVLSIVVDSELVMIGLVYMKIVDVLFVVGLCVGYMGEVVVVGFVVV